MGKFKFKALSVCGEFNISNIAKYYNINKKIKWEEPLIINKSKEQAIYLYYFGSAVFVNHNDDEIKEFLETIRSIEGSLKKVNKEINYNCVEEYRLVTHEEEEMDLTYDDLFIKDIEGYHLDITALVLAKSVALETIEKRIDVIFDEVEKVTELLKKGKINIKETEAATIIGHILSLKNNTISYIMLLDKPDVAWKNEDAKILFDDLADLFELNDRYESLNAKFDALLNTTEVFSNLSHSKKATELELIVILLIFIEVLFAFKDPLINLINLFTK
ncbi:Uncharacterized protein, Rmd1/YagE family [Clostridium cavendishii DSM 21758]|uniref:Uncharacterized protein, Rmd1/YagE family n=1 Tax=Clostridium cavendishii DSM 21758 TaxID=1121302 RepID=A0A1M6BAY6_9CLOT|nr:RMD1 family protein [Clostridium cavendishii]SHI45911.1 Uncharacterized protein, Rmd1/YagE family [Clostridium cavendishii DSM 21758]